jgi:hypothetical protein
LRTVPIAARAFRAWTLFARAAAIAGTGLRSAFAWTATFAARRRTLPVARRAHLIGSDAAVAVAVEFAQDLSGVVEFLLVDDAVVIGIERAEEAGHRALDGAVAARTAFAGWLGSALWWVRLILLREERTRGKRECHRGGEREVSFHGVGLFGFGGSVRGMRCAFIGLNAA